MPNYREEIQQLDDIIGSTYPPWSPPDTPYAHLWRIYTQESTLSWANVPTNKNETREMEGKRRERLTSEYVTQRRLFGNKCINGQLILLPTRPTGVQHQHHPQTKYGKTHNPVRFT